MNVTVARDLVADGREAPPAPLTPPTFERSRRFCEHLTRGKARNFYYGLKLLPEPKRSAMFALYAYMRLVDDIADEEDGRPVDQRLEQLEAWRLHTHTLLNGGCPPHADAAATGHAQPYAPGHDVWPAFADVARRHALPVKIFDAVIDGQRQDLRPEPFATFDGLYDYCHRVAGVVGLASIYIWGFEGGPETEAMAVSLGVGFQLTNILRDLREDATRGRTYLPADELCALGVAEDDLRHGRGGRNFRELMRFQIARAESYYRRAAGLEQRISRDSRPTLTAMTQIYRGLLDKVASEPERVLRERVSLSLLAKLRIGWRASRAR